jgi:hypothetical protein
VLADPAITNDDALHFFYRRKGSHVQGHFETMDALRAGDAVHDEIPRGLRDH